MVISGWLGHRLSQTIRLIDIYVEKTLHEGAALAYIGEKSRGIFFSSWDLTTPLPPQENFSPSRGILTSTKLRAVVAEAYLETRNIFDFFYWLHHLWLQIWWPYLWLHIWLQRITKNAIEKSIIDFVILSEDLKKDVKAIIIDDERNHVLTRITKTKNGVVKVESDHNMIFAKLNMKWDKKISNQRHELFNLKNEECQKAFKEATKTENK